MIDSSSLNYKQKRNLIGFSNWWVRSKICSFLREDFIGRPSYETLINTLLRDTMNDVSLVASDCCLAYNLNLHKQTKDINKIAQIVLKKAGLMKRITSKDSFIHDVIVDILGYRTKFIDWNKIFERRYKEILPKFVRWEGYVHTDPTACINITDTINDTLLDILFLRDGTIGIYQHGQIGSVLKSNSKFAKKYPDLFIAVKKIHDKRLETDLSHPIIRATNKPTSFIKHKELKILLRILTKGYVELWKKW